MKNKAHYRQFDVVQVDLEPTKGSEQRGIRPCVIVGTNAFVESSRTVLVAPCTTKKLEKIYPYEVLIEPTKSNGLTQVSKIKMNQTKVIDKLRIKKHFGYLTNEDRVKILHATALAFDLEQYFA